MDEGIPVLKDLLLVIFGIILPITLIAFPSLYKIYLEGHPEKKKKFEEDTKKIEEFKDRLKWGEVNPEYVCPHCQTKGYVRLQSVNRKKGISGAKVTGALLTGGLSMLATGLSRKDFLTQARCDKCKCTWDF